ncbi:aldo/keto reductase [Christensenellaceae bacterium OttesenSCG-928-M15]|nr:aldo/keto reductase [Christensenellaceae bacterium OttesenSCG-928-M15]
MKLVALGNTEILVSRLCFGTLTMGPLQKNMPLHEGVALLELAFSLGVNFLDTAELYGTYPYIREALKIKPDAVVCTKSYAYDHSTAEQSLKLAMEGIGREYIDVFMLHEQESEHTIRGHYEAIEYFQRKKEEGLIGAIGLSTHHINGMVGANKYDEIEAVFPIINKAGLGIADGSLEQMQKQISISYEKGKGIIAMKPLGGGHLIKDRLDAFSYLLDDSRMHSIAVGMQTKEEVLFDCALFSGEDIEESLLGKIDMNERRLLIHDWCEGCGRCVKRCKNKALTVQDGQARVDHDKCVLCGYCAATCPQFCIKVI